ncbi:hypothetical protein CSAL01_08612 [Colletotrichum salicis]|uniref:Uncharacterized protein n=1 Tax=Colletotrichum salicis TaxID=1209931 RepID=A0A135V3F0_9PEZI|nr:hypothetical protein CSAL01_08612 [Colletotrichum salicis]
MIKKHFSNVRLITKDVYTWWFRHNIWVIVPEDSRKGYAMTTHNNLVWECAIMSRVSCQILNSWDRDEGSWWTGHTVDYMTARIREAIRPVEEVEQEIYGGSSDTLSDDHSSNDSSRNDDPIDAPPGDDSMAA